MGKNMREIKFRIWLKDEKRMVYPIDEERYLNPIVMGINGRLFQVVDEDFGKDMSKPLKVFGKGSYVVMQYTGLKDKNGKEVYEGDIVKNTLAVRLHAKGFFNERLEKQGIKAPDFLSIIYDMRLLPMWTEGQDISDVEVIGNIWENTELQEK